MKEIEGTDLAALVAQTRADMIADDRREAGTVIRKIFQRQIALNQEKKKKLEEVQKIDKKIAATDKQVSEILAGNWSAVIIKEDNQQPKEQEA